jgi:hypothetical protein
MNFYKYLENKITLFESSNSTEYLYKNKTLYPIISKTVIVNKQEIEVTDSSFRKKFGSDYLYDPKEKSLTVISRYKAETSEKTDDDEQDDEQDDNIQLDSAQYVEVNGVYYPLTELSKYKKISKDGNLKNLNLDDYQTVKKSQMSFKIYTKGSSSGGGGNQPTEAEVSELENIAGEKTETPPEATTPETPTT